MTINNLEKFISGLWDWAILDGCFGESRIKPSDIDGIVERNGHFLVLETKDSGASLPKGQEIMFKRMAETGLFTVMIVWGKTDQPERLRVIHKKGDRDIPCDIELLRDWVDRWYKYANGI